MDEKTEIQRVAEEKVEAKLLFYKHLSFFASINILLCLINLICTDRISWALWSILGWGTLILAHAFYVIFYTQGIKESMIKKQLNNEKKSK